MKNLVKITTTSIDLTKLNKGIDKFECENKYSPYTFMEEDTLDDLINMIGYSSDGLHWSGKRFLCGRYNGRKVFCDNTLDYGEVELR